MPPEGSTSPDCVKPPTPHAGNHLENKERTCYFPHMPATILKRAPERPVPELTLTEGISLRLGRLHEVCGSARRSFAMWLAAQTKGHIFWVCPPWMSDQLHPDGVARFVQPGRLTFVAPHRPEDVLWTLEEVLGRGNVPLVVGDLSGYPALTPIRRMHLAAEQGAERSGHPPLGIILTPDHGGASGVESRWHMVPAHTGQRPLWSLSRLRARTAPPKSWDISLGAKGFGLLKDMPPSQFDGLGRWMAAAS